VAGYLGHDNEPSGFVIK